MNLMLHQNIFKNGMKQKHSYIQRHHSHQDIKKGRFPYRSFLHLPVEFFLEQRGDVTQNSVYDFLETLKPLEIRVYFMQKKQRDSGIPGYYVKVTLTKNPDFIQKGNIRIPSAL